MAQNEVAVMLKLVGADKFKNDMNSAFSSAQKSSSAFANTVKGIGTVAVAAGAMVTAAFIGISKAGISMAADMETARQGFKTLLGSVEKADAIIRKIKKDAAATPFTIRGLVQANQLLTSVTKDGNRSERMLMNVGKALAAMGKGQPELDRIIVNLQQIGSLEKAQLVDIKQFAYAGIPIYEMLSKSLKVSGDKLSEMISKGKIGFREIEKAFQDAGEGSGKFANAFVNASGTFTQLMSNLQDSWDIFAQEFVEKTGIFDIAKGGVKRLITVMADLSANLPKYIDIVKKTFEDIKMRVIALWGAFKNTAVYEILKKIVQDLDWELFAKNLVLVTIAVGGFAAVIGVLTNPITLIVIAITAVTLAITYLQQHWGDLTKTVMDFKDRVWQAMTDKWNEFANSETGRIIINFFTELGRLIANVAFAIQNYFVPVVIPVLKILGVILGVTLKAAMIFIVALLKIMWKNFISCIDAVSKLMWIINRFAEAIRPASKVITDILSKALNGFIGVVKAAYDWVDKLLRKLGLVKSAASSATKAGGMAGKSAGFAMGGVIGGSSYTGDKVLARVNSGEMVLTRGQQAELFRFIKSASSQQTINFNAPVGLGTNARPMQQQNDLVSLLNNLTR